MNKFLLSWNYFQCCYWRNITNLFTQPNVCMNNGKKYVQSIHKYLVSNYFMIEKLFLRVNTYFAIIDFKWHNNFKCSWGFHSLSVVLKNWLFSLNMLFENISMQQFPLIFAWFLDPRNTICIELNHVFQYLGGFVRNYYLVINTI